MASVYLATTCPPSSPCRVSPEPRGLQVEHAPPRLATPQRFTNPGNSGWTFTGTVTPRRYVAGWPDGVVKIGSCYSDSGQRVRDVLRSGATLLHLAYYALDDGDAAESWLIGQAAQRWPYAFACRHEAAEHLPNGGGWTECFRVPIEERPQLLALAEV